MMPVLGGARQPAHLQAEYDADVVQSDFSQEPLVSRTVVRPRAAPPLVLIDDDHAFGRPTQDLGVIRQSVLPGRRFAILQHLLRRRLSYINNGELVEVRIVNLRGGQASSTETDGRFGR